LKSGASAAEAAAERGLAVIASLGAPSVIGGYHPIRYELNPLPLMNSLRANGVRLALPRMEAGTTLAFHEWLPEATLKPGQLGVREPEATQPTVRPDVVLAPLLAFDRRGARLGYGAGYYDRSLRELRSSGAIVAIGFAFDEQEFPEVPAGPDDEPLDMILTPSRVIDCRG
jgi:5-formyltetrahydrofolate cyclo-ligase